MLHDKRDWYCICGLLALVVLAIVFYAIRLLTVGRKRSARVDKIGGTALVSQGVMEWVYWAMDPITGFFLALHITPNQITWGALALGVGAGVAIGAGWLGLAAVLATWSTLFDILDGQVARATNTGSDKGELLDAAVDRYTEFAYIAGLMFYWRENPWLLGLAMAALLACFMVSYASAKAEALHVETPRGLMRRHERSTYLIVGAGFSAMFGEQIATEHFPWYGQEVVACAIVALIGNYAAVLRFVRIGRALR